MKTDTFSGETGNGFSSCRKRGTRIKLICNTLEFIKTDGRGFQEGHKQGEAQEGDAVPF
jgi:hypothetical protein